jgi:hypothetical protein
VTTLGAASTAGVRIPVGTSYLVYYVGSTASTVLSRTRVPDNSTATAVGYANQGTIPVTFWNYTNTGTTAMPYTTGTGSVLSGVNQMGNPYPSTISLLKVYSDNSTSISPTFYELNSPGQSYISYNGLDSTRSSARASRYIVSGQGFLSIAAAAGKTFTFYEDEKTAYPNMTTTTTTKAQGGTLLMDIPVAKTNLADGSPSAGTFMQKVAIPIVQSDFVEQSNTKLSGLHLQISRDSLTYQQTGIYFARNRSDKYSPLEDAVDLGGPDPQLYLSSYSSDGVQLSINEMGDYLRGKRIKLFVKGVTDGLYRIALADIQNIDTNLFHVLLIDNLQKDSLDLTLYGTYNFNYVAGTANDSTRFVLAIEHKPVPHYALLSFSGAKSTDGVLLDWKTINEGASVTYVLQKLAANNTYVFLDSLHSDSSGAYSYIDQHPILGNNTYRLQQTDALGDITYSAPVTIGYNSSSPNGGLNIYPNPAKSMITVTLTTSSTVAQVATADIYNTSGTLIAHKVVNSNSFTNDVSSYQLGVYIIELKNNNGVLVGKSKFVKVN